MAHVICRHHEASQTEHRTLFVARMPAVYKGTDVTKFIEIGKVHGLIRGAKTRKPTPLSVGLGGRAIHEGLRLGYNIRIPPEQVHRTNQFFFHSHQKTAEAALQWVPVEQLFALMLTIYDPN